MEIMNRLKFALGGRKGNWYLITYLTENNWDVDVKLDFLKKKELTEFIKEHKILGITKLTKEQAFAYDSHWEKGEK